ncbi:MAG: NAD(P)H-hydrate dehydratase [Candidatus Thorarchaeota archaeon]|nr:NAD(P)H-hydrate dehydratase [Candidatus Thorarchaeota archaeon]
MMKDSITTDEMRSLELNSKYLGVSHSLLMQIAGREVARVITENEKVDNKSIVILSGLGGNGGDGIVAARYLDEVGAKVQVFLLGHEKAISNEDTLMNWMILKNLKRISISSLQTESDVKSCKAIGSAEILVDGLMGFGLRSKLREPLLTAVKVINKSKAIKYSIDVPTGINSDSGVVHGDAVRADHTISLHATKVGLIHAPEYSGRNHVVTIGIPREAAYVCGPGDLSSFGRPRKSTSKKGDSGRILVIGGSNVYSGAPALSGIAALRTGSDLVSILAPEPVVPAIREYSPNLMVTSLGSQFLQPEVVDIALEMINRNDVVVMGPGLGVHPGTLVAAVTIVKALIELDKPLVLDADGLKAIAASGLKLNPEKVVFTPHWGELKTIMNADLGDSTNLENRIDQAKDAAKQYNSIILLKGPVDVIATPSGDYKLNRTGSPAMTVGGTGDVLTGIVASFLSRGGSAFKAAAAGAFVSGLAGELAVKNLGEHILATDCIEQIPEVFKTL